ncbi:hypothetical protein [Cytobacillus dafuensis]|uniref:Uncharacterized protein n=1 Tax=Cytobacillus dafuensis TaxID=1742359 RepID=A0A5B8Z7B5_CYTDA|nr:hypothetical protein [Cytobacillus dafuensis]QED48093.1 hypothetical protein FSZ17_13060 [Cytobacillus dafuensis]
MSYEDEKKDKKCQNPTLISISNIDTSAAAFKNSNAAVNNIGSSVAQDKSNASDDPINSAVAQDDSNASRDPIASDVDQEVEHHKKD